MGSKNVLIIIFLVLCATARSQDTTDILYSARKHFYKKEYKESVAAAKKVLKTLQDDIRRADAWVLIGSSYDALGNHNKAIKAFKKGHQEASGYYSPAYNLGVTYFNLGKFKEAEYEFCWSASCEPDHASSHYNLMLTMDKKQNRIASMLACCRFLILEKEGLRMEKALMFLQQTIRGNVSVNGDNQISITLSPNVTGREEKNDFSKVDLMLSMATVINLGKEMENKTESERFVRNITALFTGLKEFLPEGKGFFWAYYAPYFIDLLNSGHVEAFAYSILAYKAGAPFDVKDWMEKNKSKVSNYLAWNKSYKWNKSVTP